MPLLELRDVRKSFAAPEGAADAAGGARAVHTILDVPAFALDAGEQVALAGSSGTGKTTLLHVIAGILRADRGEIRWDGADVAALGEAERDRWRARNLGYVFQTFQLLPAYTALENVLLGMAFGPGPDPAFAQSLLAELNLADRLHHRPRQLSVGQQQRVAVARALANRPRLVLADEPTGNLDARHAREALELLRRLCREHGAALLLVSHDREILGAFERREDLAAINRAADVGGADDRAPGAPR
jgi:putative ABC transport system ATP-binding protein